MRALAFPLAIALAIALAACPTVPTPPDVDAPPADCRNLIVDCSLPEHLGVETLVQGTCYLCVQTSIPEVPFAWTQVAPCSVAEAE